MNKVQRHTNFWLIKHALKAQNNIDQRQWANNLAAYLFLVTVDSTIRKWQSV